MTNKKKAASFAVNISSLLFQLILLLYIFELWSNESITESFIDISSICACLNSCTDSELWTIFCAVAFSTWHCLCETASLGGEAFHIFYKKNLKPSIKLLIKLLNRFLSR
jgi:uncharacterized membrane protein